MSGKTRETAHQYLRKLSRPAEVPGGLESATRESAMRESLTPERAERARDRALAQLERQSGDKVEESLLEELDEVFLKHGKSAIEQLERDGAEANLSVDQVEALEAIVESDGSRPSLELSDADTVDLEDATLGQWRGSTLEYAEQISLVSAAVGRIDLDGEHRGSGFVVKDDLILTNRHVLQELSEETSPGEWRFRGEPSISFDASPGEARQRQFALEKTVVCVGQQPIDPRHVDFRKHDLAVLQCKPSGAARLPAPLSLESDPDKVVVDRPIYTVGYPAKPQPGQYRFRVLLELFRNRFGVKRFAPGEIDGMRDDASTVFAHDSTTLGGNSGSCVVDLGDDGLLVVGLHFSGHAGVANYAHSSARLRSELADFANLGLTWKDWV